ncbi:hypothetical protein AB0H07_06715 [Streptomyces sp. NPDC021354]|uniref:hypothetical protein n=1 Tax=Streptomyces sp. NPDC021354 TaxID=3154793 RepID=UPI0033DADE4C
MSQPPPPPNQPPQGGFGAPQNPSYGYPQQPPGTPPAPGYGYPQAPGQPPQAPQAPPPPPPGPPQTPPPSAMPQAPPQGAGGYGYPQPQSVHAQPTQVGMPAPQFPSGQQPQYGYPPQAPYPGGMPGAPGGQGGGNQSKQRMMIIISAVVAVALIVVGGIFFATKGDGGGDDQAKDKDKDKKTSQGSSSGTTGGKDVPAPETVQGKLINKIDMPKVKDQITTEGMWVTDDTFVKADVYKIVGYPLDGGDPKWTIPLAGQICWSSAHLTEDGLTTVLFQEAKPSKADKYPSCTEVGLFDLKNGKMVWQRHVNDGDRKMRFDEVTLGGGTVAAGGTSGGAAWSVEGKELWKPQPGEECSDDGYAGGGDKLIAVRRCGQYDNPELTVQTLNPKTGTVKSTYKVSSGLDYVHVASTDPLVIGLDAGDSTGASVSDFLTIDDSAKVGKVVSKISTEGGKYVADCETTDVEGCKLIAISKSANALYMGSEDRRSAAEGTTANEVVAFSLETGKAIGKADGVERAALTPLGLDKDGFVIAYQESTYSAGGAVWRIDPKSYKKDKLLQNEATAHDMESNFSAEYDEIAYANQRLYMSDRYATKPSSSYDANDPLAVIFGAGS